MALQLCANVYIIIAAVMCSEVLDSVRANFIVHRSTIISCSKPWTPWALTSLLGIDDSKSDIPAELILYKALRKQTRLSIQVTDEVVQVPFIVVFIFLVFTLCV